MLHFLKYSKTNSKSNKNTLLSNYTVNKDITTQKNLDSINRKQKKIKIKTIKQTLTNQALLTPRL